MEDEWSNETTMYFLECYQSEPVIWDPKHQGHKDKKKVNDAWGRISQAMDNIPIALIKKKKDSLMATFRTHLRKKKASIKSGAGADDVYTPIWQFFSIMEDFLAPVYECNRTINTERQTPTNVQASEIEENENTDDTNSTLDITNPTSDTTNPPSDTTIPTSTNPTVRRRKNPPELVAAEKQMNAAFNTLNSVLNNKQPPEDDCDIYAKLLAKRLKKLPERQKEYFMFKIDELWWQIRSTSDHHSEDVSDYDIPGPSRPSRFSLNYVNSPPSPDFFRPSSAQSIYSQPSHFLLNKNYVLRHPTTPTSSVQRSSSAHSKRSRASCTITVPTPSPPCQSSASSDVSTSYPISHDAHVNAVNSDLIINNSSQQQVLSPPETSYILNIPESSSSYPTSIVTQPPTQTITPSKKIEVISNVLMTQDLIEAAYKAAMNYDDDNN